MKFSAASLLFVVPFVVATSAVAATGGTDESPVAGGGDQQPELQGYHDIFSRLRVGFRGMRQRPSAHDLAFLAQAVKRAYNVIHAPLDDDYQFIDFNISALEMQPDAALLEGEEEGNNDSSSTVSLLDSILEQLEWLTGATTTGTSEEDASGALSWTRRSSSWGRRSRSTTRNRFRISSYGISDVSCRLCGGDDDALALSSEVATLGGPPPYANIKPIEELLCKILKKEGSKHVFGDVYGCSIFQIESLGSFAFEQQQNQENEPHDNTAAKTISGGVTENGGDAMLSVALAGLTCNEEQDFAACQDDALNQLVSDALVIAYNQVNFGDDYFIENFVPTSLELFPAGAEESLTTTSSPLRGGVADVDVDVDAERLPTGTWHGAIRVLCRACNEELEDEVDPALAPFYTLKEVERIFCELISDAADQSAVLTNMKECSLSVVEMIDPADCFKPSFLVLED